MNNTNTVGKQKLSRSEYNRQYYAQNKEKLSKKDKEKSANKVLQLFAVAPDPTPAAAPIDRGPLGVFFRTIEIALLVLLTAVMTYLLVKESAGFYLDANESPFSAYAKAGMIEATAILFSLSRSKKPLLQWGQRLVLVLLCGLSLWTMSQRVVRNAAQDSMRGHASAKIIAELEAERSEKTALREKYFARGWLGATRQYEKSLDQIREKLIAAQQSASASSTTEVIASGLGVLIAFRLILLLANLICFHRIVEHFSSEAQHNSDT